MHRHLKFKNFNDARQELDRLSQGPIETIGNWSYFQILAHCAKAIEGSTKGKTFEMSWWKRHLRGPLFFYYCAWKGAVPSGIGVNPNKPVERIEGDEKAALAQLHQALEIFEKFEGKLGEHPLMGPLTKKQWALFHSWHLANHLGHVRNS